MVLDNLKVHTFEERKKYLATVHGRSVFVFTPQHGSWLNLVEGFFSKFTRQSLKGIRVKTKEELVNRIYKYFEEVNADPVIGNITLMRLIQVSRFRVIRYLSKSPVNYRRLY